MNADDVIATYNRLLTDPTSQAGSAFSGVLSDGRRHEGRRLHDHRSSWTRRRRASRTSRARRRTRRSSCRRTTPARSRRRRRPRAPSTWSSYTPGVSAKYDRNPNWWGGTAPLDGVDVTLGEDTAIINALHRRPARPAQRHRVREQPRAVQQLERPDLQGPRRDAPRDPDARRRPACSRTSACARRSRSRSTGRRSSRPCSTASPTSATTRRSRRSTRRPSAVAQRHQDIAKAKAADRGRRPASPAGRPSSSRTRRQSCRSSHRSSSRRSSRSAATSSVKILTAPSTTRAPRRRRRGSTSP